MVISILNQKGGAGKTTLAIHIAMALWQDGSRVLLVDADPQGSALDWSASRSNIPADAASESQTEDGTSREAQSREAQSREAQSREAQSREAQSREAQSREAQSREAQSRERFPVVGLPKASLHRELPKLAKDYDHIIIDGPPRVYDVTRSAILASDLVLIPVQPSPYDVWAAKEIVDLLQEAAAFNENLKSAFVINRKIVNTAIGRDVSEALSGYSVPILKTHIGQRVGFAESAAQGETVLEAAPGSTASREVRALVAEMQKFAKSDRKITEATS